MKKILLAMLVLMPALCSAQVAFNYMTAKSFTVDTLTGAIADTIWIYAPPAFGYPFTKVGFQAVNTDTTNSGANPPKYVFTTDTLDFQTLKVSGPDSSADSTMIKIIPVDADGNLMNDSFAVTAADTTADIYSTDNVVASYKVGFDKTKAPYAVAIVHIIGGAGGTFRAQYRIVWPVQIYK